MTVVGYALEEAWLSLRRSGRSALVSIGTIAIAFVTLGGFLLLSVNVQGVLRLSGLLDSLPFRSP